VIGREANGLTEACAYVVLRRAADGGALQDSVRGRLSPHTVPRLVEIVSELPKTPSGKIDRKALRA
jgi:acetyl-CoA synthetase